MVAAIIQPKASATAPATIAAAMLRSSTTCFHTSNGASLMAIAKAARNASTPRVAKTSAFNGGKSVMASLYEDYAEWRKRATIVPTQMFPWRGWPSGWASAFQADLHEFESRTPLHRIKHLPSPKKPLLR